MKDDFMYGEEYIKKNRFADALPFYFRLYDHMKDNANINYRIGQCYYHMHEKKLEAIPYLENAADNTTTDYKGWNIDNTQASVEVFLMLGDLYLTKGNYYQSYNNYMKYKTFLKNSDRKELSKLEDKLKILAVAYQLTNAPEPFYPDEEIPGLNTRFSDYCPVISRDQNTIIYTSFWETDDLIFMMQYKRGEWTKPRDISKEILTNGNTYASSMDERGSVLYYTVRDKNNSDIYYSKSTGRTWDVMSPVKSKRINTKFQDIDAFMTYDGKKMYFSSDRDDNVGMDLFVCNKEGDKWGEEVNLGKPVNTKLDEGNPFITPDNKFLVFSSNGHKGMGGYDLFICEINDDGTFSEPVNLGSPFNSSEDNKYMCYFPETSTAYYVKDTKSPHKRLDIFRRTIPPEDIEQAIEQKKESLTLAELKTDAGYINNLQYKLKPESYAETSMPVTETLPVEYPATEIAEEITEDPLPEEPVYEEPAAEPMETTEPVKEENETASTALISTLPDNNEKLIDIMSPTQYDKVEVPSSSSSGSDRPVFIEVKFDPSYRPNPYTIQIAALKSYKEPSTFFPHEKIIRVFGGPDGFYRYVLGDYWTLEAAKKNLEKAHERGYKGAFIRLVRNIPMK